MKYNYKQNIKISAFYNTYRLIYRKTDKTNQIMYLFSLVNTAEHHLILQIVYSRSENPSQNKQVNISCLK